MESRPGASLVLAALLCGALAAEAAPVPRPQHVNGVQVLSGGVGEHERHHLEQIARDYDLKAIFSLAEGPYLADVNVTIRDRHGNLVLETVSSGPWLYAKLDPGTYRIVASKFGRTVEERVTIRGQGAQRVVRLHDWTIRDAGGDVYPQSLR
jgi:hypothetical protein